jgi:hypothetical protein
MQAGDLTSRTRARAEEYWCAGRTPQAGNLLYDALPVKDRPAWAARVLRLILERSGLEASDFLEVLRIADDPAQWGNARQAIANLNAASSRFRSSYADRKLSKGELPDVQERNGLFALSEAVAMIAYNASNPRDPFDKRLGHSVASYLKTSTERWNDKEFSRKAWAALASMDAPPAEEGAGDYLAQAAEAWQQDNPLKAGRLIVENLPNYSRPKWAAGVLRLVLERSGVQSSPIDEVLHTADDQAVWGNGRRAFSIVRHETLRVDELARQRRLTKKEELLRGVLVLAELVAKVTYNAAQPPDPFDNDSGWWIAKTLRGFVDNVWRDDDFSMAAWSALSREGF